MSTTFLKNPVSIDVTASAVGLHVKGTAAAPTAGGGGQPQHTLMIEGAAGQATTGVAQIAGAGANVSITAGTGGVAPTGSTNGMGGSVTINPGPAGAGAGTAAAPGNVLLATAGGSIGIGTATPAATLHLSKAGDVGIRVTDSAANGSTSFFQSAVVATKPVTNIGSVLGDIRFLPGEMPSVTIKGGTGYLGVGTATPLAAVDVQYPCGLGSPVFPLRVTNSTAGNGPQSGVLLSSPNTTNAADRNWATNINVNAHGDFAILCSASATADPIVANTRVEILADGKVGIGTVAPTSLLHVVGGMQVGNPTAGDRGPGSINVSADVFKNGSPLNASRVLDYHCKATKTDGYAGPVPLAQLEDAIKTRGQLPGVSGEPQGVFGRQDTLLEKLEEAYLYIIELSKRIDRLEAERAGASGKETR